MAAPVSFGIEVNPLSQPVHELPHVRTESIERWQGEVEVTR